MNKNAPAHYQCLKKQSLCASIGFPKNEQRQSEWIRAHINGGLIFNKAVHEERKSLITLDYKLSPWSQLFGLNKFCRGYKKSNKEKSKLCET